MTNYNDGKWHGWNGGECPLHPETKGEFVFADGCICSRKPAGEWQWDDKELPLIAFRVTKEHKEPREFWVGDGYCFDSKSSANLAGVYDAIHVREVTK